MKRIGGSEDDDQRSSRNTGQTFTGQHKSEDHEELLAKGQWNACSLRHEDTGERKIQGAAVEVEAVSRRHYEGDDLPRYAKRFHGFHGAGQSGFRTGSSKRNGRRFSHGLEEARYGNPENQCQGQKNAQYKHNKGGVKRSHKFEQIYQHAEAQAAQGISDRSAHRHWRKQHDDVRELEHRLGKTFHEVQNRAAFLLLDLREGNAKDDAEYYNLEDLVLRDRLGDVFREDMQDQVSGGRFLELRGRCSHVCGRFDPDAGLVQIDRAQSDKQGNGSNDFKVDQRLDAHAANLLEVGVSGNPNHQCRKDQRSDDGPDHAQKN